jgi:MFS family permease
VTIDPRVSRRALAWLSLAMVLGMAPWFSGSVAASDMIATWHLAGSFAPWLTISVQLGFVVGTLASAVLMLSDRWNPRRFAGGSALIAAVATASIAALGDAPAVAIALRTITGVALAGVYPPGLKLAAGWARERRGLAIGVLISALTLGSAAPNLLRAVLPPGSWRSLQLIAGVSAAVAGALMLIAVREGPYQAATAPFDLRALGRVLTNRGVVRATGGYLGHMWELYAMWTSMGAFWLSVAAARGMSAAAAYALAFLTIASGSLGCVVAGEFADRIGRARVTIIAMSLSGVCALGIGGLLAAPLPVLVVVALVWGATVVADSAQFSACVTELAPASYVGTALTLQTCLGFLLTTLTIGLLPRWVAAWGWTWAFAPLAFGPAFGIWAMAGLSPRPNASHGTGAERAGRARVLTALLSRRRVWLPLVMVSLTWKLVVLTLGAAVPGWIIPDGIGDLPTDLQAFGRDARRTARALWNGPIERRGLVRVVRLVSIDSNLTTAEAAPCGGYGARVRAYTYFAIPYSEARVVCSTGTVEYRLFRRRHVP